MQNYAFPCSYRYRCPCRCRPLWWVARARIRMSADSWMGIGVLCFDTQLGTTEGRKVHFRTNGPPSCPSSLCPGRKVVGGR
jgi:hypothetical protein